MFKEWDPLKILFPTTGARYALLVLNQPINLNAKHFDDLWQKASIRMVVDGGTNQLKAHSIRQSLEYIPDVITGDMDSCNTSFIEELSTKGSKIIKTPDQDNTDFTKSLMVLSELVHHDEAMDWICVVCENSGRLDHILANLNTLYEAGNIISSPVFIMSSNTITWLLEVGNHSLRVEWPNSSSTNCALLPVGQPCKNVRTKGLCWDLGGESLRFGELISSSNRFSGINPVEIYVSNPLIFSMDNVTLH